MEFVEQMIAEFVEVGAAVGCLERDVVGDERDGIGEPRVWADECVQVSAVGGRIFGDLGRFAM
jgi:hypothetical protein